MILYLNCICIEDIIKMEDQSIANIVNGIPCSLSNNQLMELGVKCSREGYSLEKMIEISVFII